MMKNKVLLGLICCISLLFTSCQSNSNKNLQNFIGPHVRKEYKHLLIVPQFYCLNCIRTLFEKIEHQKLKSEVGILFLEIHTANNLPKNILTAKYEDYCKITKDTSTELVWVELENCHIKKYQRLSSIQFYEHLPKWIK